ncbi:enhanced serine sensitivity protein SseB [Rouxiella badensis]|uniref:enhanced serine sensitivity protein SseB n=1 Tax=Rouxiella badensis TaxID=1646377 RepID=UPI000366F687|nr:enhanced serine sensitivity protein SseB [Rouxiella badensis]MCC3704046.1 enhanced serine sensitivity protein SseB [Rouxiella badensis]MCC3719067.1 enhanced serine sensitivity protein SseB [Rouxiella badensis]MCC3729121.1 enhanced serine sensitivity protein SseB [Rouxiella badensis]MCC3733654.1 enhanced serine sensitivity protein SseB [Rouxiella badensis]MCC3740672.1 enhanced serine sensitivity protein SseB [Rouxiella badensis]
MSVPHDIPAASQQDENELERLLRLSVTQAAYRPAFYQKLLESTVWVLGDAGQEASEIQQDISAGSELNLLHWEKQDGSSIIPVFSSVEVLERAVAGESEDEQSFVALPARILFEMTQGEELFLNPKSEYGKELYPSEITMLLNTGGLAAPAELTLDAESQLLIGQPEQYPSAMVDALTTLFSQKKPVRRAFLALIHDKAADPQPNLLVGVEADGTEAEVDALIREAGNVAAETSPDDSPVDFCIVNEKERGLSHYLVSHTQPFYQRKWGSWLRNIIPSSGKA